MWLLIFFINIFSIRRKNRDCVYGVFFLLHTWFTAHQRDEEFFFFQVYFLLTVDDIFSVFSCSNLLLAGLRARACKQEFCIGVSRFMQEIPYQKVCLVGP